MMTSVLSWTILDGITKKLTQSYTVFEIIFLRDSINAFFLVCIGLKQEGTSIFKIHQTKSIHCWRSLLAVMNAIGYTYAVSRLSLSDTYTLGFSAPLFMLVFSKILQADPINKQRWFCLILGFLGIITILRPGKEIFNIAGVMALMVGVFYAISTVLIGKIDKKDSSFAIALYPTIASFLLGAAGLPQGWHSLCISDFGLFFLTGALAALAQYTIIKAVRLAPLSLIAPLEYSSLVWVILIDYFLFEFTMDIYLSLGMLLIVGSNLYLIFHEGRTVLKKSEK